MNKVEKQIFEALQDKRDIADADRAYISYQTEGGISLTELKMKLGIEQKALCTEQRPIFIVNSL